MIISNIAISNNQSNLQTRTHGDSVNQVNVFYGSDLCNLLWTCLLYFAIPVFMRTRKGKKTLSEREQRLVEQVQVRKLQSDERPKFMRLLAKHHYLGEIKPVGEQMLYVAVTANGGWVALLVFAAAAKNLKARETWIGWTPSQKRKRLALMANNARFLVLSKYRVPNMGSRILKLAADRISADWQKQYAHPLVALETFVDIEQFRGTVYIAAGWVELGKTSGYGRCRKDYYVKHNKPKALFVKELYRNAKRSLQAEHLKPALAVVEEKVVMICEKSTKELRSLKDHFRSIADFRSRIESYPIWTILAIVACAHFAGAPRGPTDLAAFAKRLTLRQRRALGIRRDKQRKYPTPSASSFCRILQKVDALKVEEAILAYQAQIRGPAPVSGVVALDGKEPKHSGGKHIVNAMNVPDLYYLGSQMVDSKTNEIPVARELLKRIDVENRLVILDALHTQRETGRVIVLKHGGDYIFTVKENQSGLRKTLASSLADIPARFSPSERVADACLDGRDQS